MKSRKFLLASGGLILEAAFLIAGLITGKWEAAREWAAFFFKIYCLYAGVNQLQKWIFEKIKK